jgi:hypothetical protein
LADIAEGFQIKGAVQDGDGTAAVELGIIEVEGMRNFS